MSYKNSIKAFSLPEVLLSIFVLLAGILPVFGAMNGGMQGSLESEYAIIASELAQEGTELVQNVRDSSFAQGGTGFEVFENAHVPQYDCRLDYMDSSHMGSFSNSARNVFNHPTTGEMDCSGGLVSANNHYYDLVINAAGIYQRPSGAIGQPTAGRFKRHIALTKSGGMYSVYSVVFWGADQDLDSSFIADIASECTTTNKCAYARAELLPWK